MFQAELKTIIDKVKKFERSAKLRTESALPSNAYFLDEDTVCCYPRDFGDSRYPYSHDGFTLWAYSSGMMSVNESAFYVILPALGGKEPYASFFAGIKKGKTFIPVALQEVNKQPIEKGYKRYCVYTPKAVYYIVETPQIISALRAYVTANKEVCFSVSTQNKSRQPIEIYLASYINCFLKHGAVEGVETNWFRGCKAKSGGFVFESVEDLDRTTHLEHYAVLKRETSQENLKSVDITASRSVFTGSSAYSVVAAKSLITGAFGRKKLNCKFTEAAIAGDIITYSLPPKHICRVDYRLNLFEKRTDAEKALTKQENFSNIDNTLAVMTEGDKKKYDSPNMLTIKFNEYQNGKIKSAVFNKFLKSVMRQVEFCALAKNSGVSLLGIRDVFQQIEAALIWNPQECRAKIIEALGFIDPSGRPPRQYSMPAKAGGIPKMDLRPFIDQGVWIINTIYSYLSYTGDYSILDEICGYYVFCESNRVETTNLKDSVFEHLVRIMDYLLIHIDHGHTNCLRTLYGDWNDALDGLGTTVDSDKEYGTGVSVMTSLQLYQNLSEMCEIISMYGKGKELVEKYSKAQNLLKKGLIEHAVIKNKVGQAKILHGWGDKKSYLVGSFSDTDGASRDSLTSNSFWVLSGALDCGNSVKPFILAAFERLDSKYGLKTFEPFFPEGMKGVGRIVNLPPGTAENAAAYVHATMFEIWALFRMDEPERAWRQLEKSLPFTHKKLSTTPFVMSNSYALNEEYEMDGESMSDWFTGSSNVLLKLMVRGVFGINATLNGIIVTPAKYFPVAHAEIKLKIKGVLITVIYKNKNKGRRCLLYNSKPMELENIYLSNSELKGNIKIEIND